MEKIIFTYNTKDYNDEPYRVFLDRKAVSAPIAEANYDDINGKTHLHIGNAYGNHLSTGAKYGVVTSDGHYYEFTYNDVKNDNVYINRDLRGQKVTFGELFTFYVQLSQLMIKQRTEAGVVAEEEGRLQLSRMKINFSKSGYFEVQVKHNDTRDAHYYYHTARVLGATNNKMNVIPMETGSMTIPIMGKNANVQISIKTQAPTAMSLMGYTWEGNYIKRTKSL